MPTSATRGRSAGSQALNAVMPEKARATPSAPPASPSTSASVTSCRASRPRPAPSAVRTASSRDLAVARTSIRFATFTQAIRNTSETAPSRTESAVRTPDTRLSARGMSRTPHPAFSLGYCRERASAIVASSASAAGRVTPARRRPTTVR